MENNKPKLFPMGDPKAQEFFKEMRTKFEALKEKKRQEKAEKIQILMANAEKMMKNKKVS